MKVNERKSFTNLLAEKETRGGKKAKIFTF